MGAPCTLDVGDCTVGDMLGEKGGGWIEGGWFGANWGLLY